MCACVSECECEAGGHTEARRRLLHGETSVFSRTSRVSTLEYLNDEASKEQSSGWEPQQLGELLLHSWLTRQEVRRGVTEKARGLYMDGGNQSKHVEDRPELKAS